MAIALFVGRFQPLHLGHGWALQAIAIAPDVEKIVVAVGSAQYSAQPDNPYDLAARVAMLESIAPDLGKPVEIKAVPDIHDPPRWVAHLIKITGPVDVVYTGNKIVKGLFEAAGYEVRPVNFEIDISGTQLRQWIKDRDERWKKYVPLAAQKFI